jgi:hypothetical protein
MANLKLSFAGSDNIEELASIPLEQIHVSWKHEFALAFFSSHFRTENRIPLFLKVL